MIGIGATLFKRAVMGSRGFSPSALFANGEEGVWYDPSDLSTLFASSYGTTPAVSGGPVGLILDKSKGLEKQLIDPSGTGGGATYTASTKTVVFPRNGTYGTINFPATVGEVFKISGTVTIADTATSLKDSANPSFPTVAVFDSFGTYGFDTYFTCLTQDEIILYINDYGAGSSAVTITGLLVEKVLGNHAIQETLARCPTLTESSNLYYLDFDGADDGMRTALNVPFGDSSVQEMSVFAAAQKNTAGVVQNIAELSDNLGIQEGVFRLLYTSGNVWRSVQKGTVANTLQSTVITDNPDKIVATSVASISAPSHLLRIDGSVVNSNTNSLGNGPYTNQLLSIGSRAGGTSSRLDGRIYGIIVRGKVSTEEEISNVEKYLAAKSGVTL